VSSSRRESAIAISRPFDRDRGSATGPRINHRIRVPQVRVVSADGEMLGVLDTPEALRVAREGGLDLVEVNPKAFPPVCKIMDFGKFKYEEKKRQAEARKRQSTVELKEIKLRPKTDDHDIEVKLRHILRFLGEGDKVKCTVRFRGREITHPEMAERQLRLIVQRLGSNATVEAEPKMEGRTMTLLLAPPKGTIKQPPKAAPPPGTEATHSPAPVASSGPSVERR
jgi:translation initiation factor IF-3